MKSYFCVFVIFLILILSQNEVKSISNIGLVVNNLTRIWTNETCEAAGTNCTYSMNLCFSFSDALNCSIINIAPTLSWVVKPGKSKIIGSGGRVSRGVYNPVRVELKTWKAQKVVLKADIWRKDTPSVFIETLKLQGRLPYPIKSFGKLDEVQITECGVYFCLNVWLYMWCDDIPGCVGIHLTSTLPAQTTTPSLKITSLYPISTTPVTTMETHKRKTSVTTITNDHRTISTSPLAMVSTFSYPKPTTPAITTMETHKTRTEPSKFPTDYVIKTTHDHRTINTTTPGEGWVPASITTMSSYSSRSYGQDNSGDSDPKLVKSWWFWLCMVAVVLVIALAVVMVKTRYKKRTSKIIHITTSSKNKLKGEVIENYNLDDYKIS